MIPYADFTYFVLLLYVAVPTMILGLFGRAGWRWALLVTAVMLLVQYRDVLHLRAHFPVREIWLVLAFSSWQWLIVRAFELDRFSGRDLPPEMVAQATRAAASLSVRARKVPSRRRPAGRVR